MYGVFLRFIMQNGHAWEGSSGNGPTCHAVEMMVLGAREAPLEKNPSLSNAMKLSINH